MPFFSPRIEEECFQDKKKASEKNMNTLILYATKSGASDRCAHILADRLGGCTVCSLSAPLPDITHYDRVIIGSGVRVGKLYKPARQFLTTQQDILLGREFAFFLCNALPNEFEKTVAQNIPQALRDTAVTIRSFGGKMPFWKKDERADWLLTGEVALFVEELQQ